MLAEQKYRHCNAILGYMLESAYLIENAYTIRGAAPGQLKQNKYSADLRKNMKLEKRNGKEHWSIIGDAKPNADLTGSVKVSRPQMSLAGLDSGRRGQLCSTRRRREGLGLLKVKLLLLLAELHDAQSIGVSGRPGVHGCCAPRWQAQDED